MPMLVTTPVMKAKKKRITDLVEAWDGGYYKVPISTVDGITGAATIPDKGRVAVYKEGIGRQTSFAWKIRQAEEEHVS